MSEKQQSAQSHARVDPIHVFLLLVSLTNVLVQLYATFQRTSYAQLWVLILSIAFFLAIAKTRINALRVQDRVIRLEETLRMQRVLPAGMHDLIGRLRVGQFVALRFASDSELPALVQKTVTDNLKGKEIKAAIKDWRPDYFRV